jgi:parvulin-like peptidyl-prolyl isomerase
MLLALKSGEVSKEQEEMLLALKSGEVSKEQEEMLLALKSGEVSKVIEQPSVFLIFKLDKRNTPELADVKDKFRKNFHKTNWKN